MSVGVDINMFYIGMLWNCLLVLQVIVW